MKPSEYLIIIRKVLPVIYILIGYPKPLIIIPSIALLTLELIPRLNRDLELTIAHLVIPSLINNPYSIPLSILLTAELHTSLRTNEYPWYYYALALAASTTLSLFLLGMYASIAYLIPLGYVITYTLITASLFLTARFELRADRELRFVAGGRIRYTLEINTKPRFEAIMKIKTPKSISITPHEIYINGNTRVGAIAHYRIGGIKSPRLIITLVDVRNLLRIKRIVKHPDLVVVPRTQWAIEAAQRFMASLGPSGYVGDVTEAREYVPGDPIRRIHWKKTLRLGKLVIKVLSQQRGSVNVLVLPYTSNEVKRDVMGGLLVYLITETVTNGSNARVILIMRDGTIKNYLISKSNMWSSIRDVLSNLESLRIHYVGGVDQVGYFDGIRRTLRNLVNTIAEHYESIIIGERKWISSICGTYIDNCIPI